MEKPSKKLNAGVRNNWWNDYIVRKSQGEINYNFETYCDNRTKELN